MPPDRFCFALLFQPRHIKQVWLALGLSKRSTFPQRTTQMERYTMHIVLVSAVITAAATSCVKVEVAEELGRKQITYNLAPVKTGTRAATFSVFPTDSTFGTTALYLPDAKTWLDNAEESVQYIGTEMISFRDNVWKSWESGNTYWWPHSGSLSFFSWAPFNLKDRGLSCNPTEGIRIDGWKMQNVAGYGTVSGDGCTDILTARSLDLSGGEVRTQFRHALCKVSFVISLDYAREDGKTWTVEKAELKDIYTKGDFIGTSWSGYSEVRNYVNEMEAPETLQVGTNTVLFPKTFMLPQPLTRSADGSRIPRIEITCWDGISYKYVDGEKVKDKSLLTGLLYTNTTELIRWKEGTDITYHLYVTAASDNYIEFDASTGEWDYGTGSDIELK